MRFLISLLVCAFFAIGVMIAGFGCSENSQDGDFIKATEISHYLPLDNPETVDKIQIIYRRREFQHVLKTEPGKTEEWEITVPELTSTLDFSIGISSPQKKLPPATIHAVVEIATDEGSSKVYQRFIYLGELSSNINRIDTFLIPVSIPLTEYQGRNVTITFSNSLLPSHSEQKIKNQKLNVLWGNPRIVSEKQERGIPVVLLCIDTANRNLFSVYGGDGAMTRNLDQFANDSVVFTNAVSQSPWTMPSVASVLTGLYPSMHGAGYRFEEKPDDYKGPSRMHASGWFLSTLSFRIPIISQLLDNSHLTYLANTNINVSRFANVANRFRFFSYGINHAHLVNKAALEWLDQNHRNPFFLYLHYIDAHQYHMPLEQQTVQPRDDEDYKVWIKAMYNEGIRSADEAIGDVLTDLKQKGLYDQALIIFYSDHGEHLLDGSRPETMGHGGVMSKRLLHVPLMVKFPDNEFAGQRVESMVQLVDIFPTVLEETGGTVPKGLEPLYQASDTKSLRRIIAGEKHSRNYTIAQFMLYGDERIAIRNDQYLLVHNITNNSYELFDALTDEKLDFASLQDDPELRNLLKALIEYEDQFGQISVDDLLMELDEGGMKELENLGYIQ